jgi:hypothetical protein
MLAAAPPGAAAKPRLHLSARSAVPGQVVVLSASGLTLRGAKVRVGGKPARVVLRRRKKLEFSVPELSPGARRVRVRAAGRRLSVRLRIRRGFDGQVAPHPDRTRSASKLIGPEGGEVSASASDGTTFKLTVPPGAVGPATEITLTPVKAIGDFPLSGKPAAVEFAPDGLRFSQPATLRITYARLPKGKLTGFVYDGSGRDFGLRAAKVSGKTLRLSVDHFSSTGAATITAKDMVILLGQLAAKLVSGQLTLADVSTFAAAWSSFFAPNPSDCENDPTCAFVLSGTTGLLDAQASRFRCLGATGLFDGDPPRGSEALDALRLGLQIDADLRLLGRNRQASQLSDARLCITRGLVQEATTPAEDDPTGITAVPITAADAARADRDGDGKANNCEWAVQVAGTAAIQGFVSLQSQAQDACERGLQKMIDDGAKRCDEVLTEGKDILEKGQKVAVAVGVLVAEFDAALAECKPKVFVTPKTVNVEIGKTQSFTARSNEGDTDFDWTTTDGTIDVNGLLTAPAAPGSLTVTATTRRILSGTATVTVTCPAGQVEFQGQCKTISVSITPTSVNLSPGATQQFTATVQNATNTAVTWTKSGGSITANGFYTAPQAPGNYTVTATSVQDPAKKGTAQVTVGAGTVSGVARGAGAGVHGSAFGSDPGVSGNTGSDYDTSGTGPPPPALTGPYTANKSGAASGAGPYGATSSSNASIDLSSNVSYPGGALSFDLTATGTVSATAAEGGPPPNAPPGTKSGADAGAYARGDHGLIFHVADAPVAVSCTVATGNPTSAIIGAEGSFFSLTRGGFGSSDVVFQSSTDSSGGQFDATLDPGNYAINYTMDVSTGAVSGTGTQEFFGESLTATATINCST